MDYVWPILFFITLLIGADHYWEIVEDHVIRSNGPTAVGSKLGYLLSGPLLEHTLVCICILHTPHTVL